MNKYFVNIGILLSVFTLSNCQAANKSNHKTSFPSKKIGMPNPASVYCLKLKGKLIKRQNNLGEYNDCLLPGGQVIEEWTLFRRDHSVKN